MSGVSEEWEDAVERLKQCSRDTDTNVRELYLIIWRGKSTEWQNRHAYGPEDAAILNRAIDEVMGVPSFSLASQADEYEEAMKAVEIMDSISTK